MCIMLGRTLISLNFIRVLQSNPFLSSNNEIPFFFSASLLKVASYCMEINSFIVIAVILRSNQTVCVSL